MNIIRNMTLFMHSFKLKNWPWSKVGLQIFFFVKTWNLCINMFSMLTMPKEHLSHFSTVVLHITIVTANLFFHYEDWQRSRSSKSLYKLSWFLRRMETSLQEIEKRDRVEVNRTFLLENHWRKPLMHLSRYKKKNMRLLVHNRMQNNVFQFSRI